MNKRHPVFEEQRTVCAPFIWDVGHPSLCTFTSQAGENKASKVKQQTLHDLFAAASAVLETTSSASSLGCFGDAVMSNCTIWLGLLPRSYLHWPVEPLPLKHWRYIEKLLGTCMWLEQTRTRWPFKIAVRRKASHWADASLILEKRLPSCHFPLTHLLEEFCLF